MAREIKPVEEQIAALKLRLEELEAKSLPAPINDRQVAIQRGAETSSDLGVIRGRMADASPADAYRWALIRGELVKQNEYAQDRAHLRRLETLQTYAKVGLSTLAIGGGIGLALAGAGLPAFLCLGAGLYGLAPSFINTVAKRVLGMGPKDDE